MPAKSTMRPSTIRSSAKSPPEKSISNKATHSRQKVAHKKQPPSDVERLKRLFTSLCAQVDGGHFANAIKTCEKILRIVPHDPDALQTKIFLLLQTDQYVTALSLLNDLSNAQDNLNKPFAYEKGYSLYRLHRESDAMGVLNNIKAEAGSDEDNRGVIHLEAQLAYREGEYQIAFDRYNTLLDTAEPHSDEQADILTNLSAAQAHVDFLTSGFLSALSSLPSSVSESLESVPPPAPAVSTVIAQNLSVPSQSQPQGKKPRARRIPKGIVVGVTPMPDPERWLKKSERTSYLHSHGKRKGRGAGGGATQGIVESPAIAGATGAGGGSKGKKKGKK
ncbi:uncharacterized protein FIBRA_08284 [Fibroporia radiculosa]|uniref:Signal recognition particle subunit SRP72 n=1 Tax=Fibroporia radiculosa TaxID=599839 RepID=J4GH08_9APHY|nr:uncharacterized protein FIBRA_08284 [Fibroporia radiculosa]CCM06038.1 predicted protein [Fibroporia radiculosa]